MDYGGLNRLLGREVDQEFWGTRIQHILGVAGCLALTDHASQAAFQRTYKKELCFAKSPAAFVAHTFLFIFTGVTLYCAGDAALNPNHKDEDRLATFKGETYNSYVGSNTAWVSTHVPRFCCPVWVCTISFVSVCFSSSFQLLMYANSFIRSLSPMYPWRSLSLPAPLLEVHGSARPSYLLLLPTPPWRE